MGEECLMLIPLKMTTDYSLLKSTITIDSLIAFLKEKNISTCAIVDENLYGPDKGRDSSFCRIYMVLWNFIISV